MFKTLRFTKKHGSSDVLFKWRGHTFTFMNEAGGPDEQGLFIEFDPADPTPPLEATVVHMVSRNERLNYYGLQIVTFTEEEPPHRIWNEDVKPIFRGEEIEGGQYSLFYQGEAADLALPEWRGLSLSGLLKAILKLSEGD